MLCRKRSSKVSGAPSGVFSASPWSAARTKCAPSAAASAGTAEGGLSKATPPSRIDASDWVSSFSPAASMRRSTPLACQKRLLAVTKRS